jgi:hypothetical protein
MPRIVYRSKNEGLTTIVVNASHPNTGALVELSSTVLGGEVVREGGKEMKDSVVFLILRNTQPKHQASQQREERTRPPSVPPFVCITVPKRTRK